METDLKFVRQVGKTALAISLSGVAVPFLCGSAATSGSSAVTFLAQLVLLMLVGRLLGELMIRFGQPSVMGMLLGGILLGPSAFGLLWPDLQQALFPKSPEQKAMLDGIAQLGVLLLLLLTARASQDGRTDSSMHPPQAKYGPRRIVPESAMSGSSELPFVV
jgi:Kef-type K+ transport system membrane component KefB